MTKKDYIAVAKILASHRNNIPTDHFNDLVADFCAIFKANNPRFDDMKFCTACKMPWQQIRHKGPTITIGASQATANPKFMAELAAFEQIARKLIKGK